MYAETIYVNGKVYTMEADGEYVEAFAVRDKRIIATGTSSEMQRLTYDKEVNLEGKCVLPGFIDSHLHMLAYGRGLLAVDLRQAKSIAEVKNLLKLRAETTPKGQWIRGLNFDHEEFSEGRMPTKHDLNEVSQSHPILISRYCQHAHVANQLALDMAGIDRNYKPETHDSMKVDENGEPTGVLWETAVTPVLNIIPNPIETYKEKKEAARAVCHDMAKYGLTGGHTIRGKYVDLDERLDIYQDLEDEGDLAIRVYVSFDDFPEIPIRSGLGNEKVRYGFYKIYLDGSLGARGAAMFEEYSDMPGQFGVLTHSPDKVEELVTKANELGLQVGIHCIGDRGIDIAVNAIEKAMKKNPRSDARFRLIHVLALNQNLIDRCKKLPVMFDLQPKFLASDARWAEDRLGPERSHYGFAWKKLIDAGFICTGGSDSPVEPYNPFLGIYAAVTRQTLDGYPEGGWHPENKISVYEALSLYTKNGAYASFEENIKGTITKGKLADFIIIDNDPYTVAPERLKDIKVLRTYLGGEITFDGM